jgi:hypothetical protein
LRGYLLAKKFVITAGFQDEIDWQEDRSLARIEEPDFLREAAWVVLSSGMREAVIRKHFPAVSVAFCEWESALRILERKERCREQALTVFGHRGKIDAILEIARRVGYEGFQAVKDKISQQGPTYIQTLPFMGKATAFHLAKNLGLDVVKPDRHLVRVSEFAGYPSPHEMCVQIAESLGERVSVVDLVIWRFATLNTNYVHVFTSAHGVSFG